MDRTRCLLGRGCWQETGWRLPGGMTAPVKKIKTIFQKLKKYWRKWLPTEKVSPLFSAPPWWPGCSWVPLWRLPASEARYMMHCLIHDVSWCILDTRYIIYIACKWSSLSCKSITVKISSKTEVNFSNVAIYTFTFFWKNTLSELKRRGKLQEIAFIKHSDFLRNLGIH